MRLWSKPMEFRDISYTNVGRDEMSPDAGRIPIQASTNLRSAAGNDMGLRFGLKDSDYRFCRLLNGDIAGALAAAKGQFCSTHQWSESE